MSLRVTKLAPLVAALAALFVLGGCAGSSQIAPPANSTVAPVAGAPMSALQQPLANEQDIFDACLHGGSLKVRPCHVVLDPKHPGPATIDVRSHGRAITESDNCGSQGIATVTKLHDFVYKVHAGTTDGRCAAHFQAPGLGHGTLTIVNNL